MQDLVISPTLSAPPSSSLIRSCTEQRLACVSHPLPEAAHHTGSAFMSSSLRVCLDFFLHLLFHLTLEHKMKEFQMLSLQRSLQLRPPRCIRQPVSWGFKEADSISCPAALTFGERRMDRLMWAAEWSRVCFYGPSASEMLPLSHRFSLSVFLSLCPPLTMPACLSLFSISLNISLPCTPPRPLPVMTLHFYLLLLVNVWKFSEI